MSLRKVGGALALALAASAAGLPCAAQERQEPREPREAQAAETEPRDIGLTESSRARLAQVDITVRGPREKAAALTADDFLIRINLTRLEAFELDRLCSETAPAALASEGEGDGAGAGGVHELPPSSFVFYLDQPHLTLGGRATAIRTLERLIPELIGPGRRGMLVSNGRELRVFQPFTDDPAALLAALARLEDDLDHLDLFAEQETERIGDVVDALNSALGGSVQQAVGQARQYQRLEARRTDRSLRRLAMTLGTLAETSPPKAVLYFADTVRANAGEHYLSFFGRIYLERERTLSNVDSMMAEIPFDRVVNEASAQGVRFYTVKADGLSYALDPLPNAAALNRTGNSPGSYRGRQQHAQDTLANLARETGGESFLFGARPKRMAERILEDFSCVYIASFDPSRFDEDEPLRVKVTLDDPELEVHVRGRLVVPSEAARTTSRLLAAFTIPGEAGEGFGVRGEIVPTGFADGVYSALLQIRVPATRMVRSIWDVGASVIRRDKVREEISGRFAPTRPGTTFVFEREIRLEPGEHEIVFVAHETVSGVIESDQRLLDLPRLDRGADRLSPISVLQPEPALFLRADETRDGGSMALGPDVPLAPERPIALIALVCGASGESLRVERSLTGASTVTFDPLPLDLEQDSCAQIRDVVPADSLEAGTSYVYRMELLREDRTLGAAERRLDLRALSGGNGAGSADAGAGGGSAVH